MSETKTWVEALDIDPEKLSAWSEEVPSGIPLLVWAIEKGKISSEEYLKWASENFGLPILRSEYFAEAFDKASLESSRNTWDPWCYPVGQWEDVTIVACVEPPQEKPEGKFAFVLADAATLIEMWSGGSVAGVKNEDQPPSLEFEAPAGVNLGANTTFELNLDNLTIGDHAVSAPLDPHPVPPALESESEEAVEVTGALPTLNIPGLDDDDSVSQPPSVAAPKKIATPAAVSPAAVAPAAKAAPVLAAVETSAPVVIATAKPPKSRDEGVKFESAYANLKEHYQTAFVLKCTATEASMYDWDNTVAPGKMTPISLATPSMFRIVHKTQQPYHGYVVDSATHRDFFTQLNIEGLPACLTAVPLMANTKVWGILVAIGDENSQTNAALESAQKIAEGLSELLGGTWAKAAA